MAVDHPGTLRERCYACGHRLRFEATYCPKCWEHFDDRKGPKKYPAKCKCDRCRPARATA